MRRKVLKAELGRLEFRPVLADVASWATVINLEVFGGRLDLQSISFTVKPIRGKAWGLCHWYVDHSIEIVLGEKFPSKAIFLNVLAHELVHAYQLQNGLPHGHGPSFWSWKAKFKQNGLHLAETIGAEEKWR